MTCNLSWTYIWNNSLRALKAIEDRKNQMKLKWTTTRVRQNFNLLQCQIQTVKNHESWYPSMPLPIVSFAKLAAKLFLQESCKILLTKEIQNCYNSNCQIFKISISIQPPLRLKNLLCPLARISSFDRSSSWSCFKSLTPFTRSRSAFSINQRKNTNAIKTYKN